MAAIELEKDRPTIEIVFRDQSHRLDLFTEYDALCEIVAKYRNDNESSQWIADVRDYLNREYKIDCSRIGASEFFNAIMEAVKGLKKKNGTPAESPTVSE